MADGHRSGYPNKSLEDWMRTWKWRKAGGSSRPRQRWHPVKRAIEERKRLEAGKTGGDRRRSYQKTSATRGR